MNEFFNKSVEDSFKELNSDSKSGISSSEAQKRMAQYGENRLEEKAGKSMVQMFMDQFKDFLVIILIVAAVISIALGEVLDGSIILAIVVLNSILGVTQENKASNALKALKELSSPLAKVVRDGKIEKIQSNLVTIGDVIILEAGDYLPADIRLTESINLKIDESALTGESVPVEKKAEVVLPADAVLGDRINCGFMGTVVTYGRGRGIVTGIGMKTQMGKIAAMLSDTEEEATPLQQKLDSFGKMLGIICLAVCAIIFGLGFLRQMDLFEMFMTSVSLAVAAIPEGLTVVVTVVLAMGMQRMVKSNAIIKRLSAVETLGSTTVICSDKTGTLTQNKMTVVSLFDGNSFYKVSGTGYSPSGEITEENGNAFDKNSLMTLFKASVLCNDAHYVKSEEKMIGDPTEGALLVAATKYGIDADDLTLKNERLKELPFDSDRKLMSTFHKGENDFVMYTKGAPDEVLKRCTHIYLNGVVVPLTDKNKSEILNANETFAKSALRVLGVSFKEVTTIDNVSIEKSEKDLVFAGLLGMIDPPRIEVYDAIKTCKNAGIGVKMITGDHKITATAIATQIGIIDENATGELALSGIELNDMDDNTLREKVKTINVFARVSPEHKVRLVEAVRANGNIAAMTGDGVNDAPSLKRADIGIAMAITGTDVSKEASDMILTDDNFASIVKAVEEGRTIYNNIRKVVGYLLSCNIGEILIIFVAMLIGFPVPLDAIQLLAINLITDAFPAFALGMEEKEDGIMNIKPRDPKEPIVNKPMQIAIVIQSVALAAGALLSFAYGFYRAAEHPQEAKTMCFVTLVIGELLRAYSNRSETKSLFKMNFFSNSFLNKSVLFSLIFLFASVYLDFMQPIFKTSPLSIDELGFALLFAVLPVVGGEIAKVVSKDKH